jgi:osmoprotectant transport system permease protein
MNDIVDGFHWLTTSSNWWGDDGLLARLREHLWYSLLATAIAVLIGLPVGALVGHVGRGRFAAASASNVLRAIPTIGVVTVLYRWRPLSLYPIVVSLAILAIPPIMLNVAAGIESVDRQTRDAARAMGLTPWQVLTRVELPCAMPFALAGLRSATNQVLATATIAGFRGLGGLGRYVFSGFGTQRYDVVYGATIAIIALILLVELGFVVIQRLVVSPGVRQAWRHRHAAELSAAAVPSISPALTPSPFGGPPP